MYRSFFRIGAVGFGVHKLYREVKAKELDVKYICQKCDEYWRILNVEKLFEFVSNHKDLDDVEIQWRLARAMREYSIKFPDQAKDLIPQAYAAAKRAVELDDDNWAAHKWCGILLGDFSELQGTGKFLEASLEIKKHFEESVNQFKDSTTMYCLGMWHFRFTELSWYKRKIAAAYYRVSVPPSSYVEALDWFLKAEENENMFYDKNHLMIARCYMRLDAPDKALHHFKIVIDWPLTHHDEVAFQEALYFVAKLSKK